MRHSTLLRRYAPWGLALGVMVACGTPNNTPPTTYGYPPEDAGSSVGVSNAAGPAASQVGEMSSSVANAPPAPAGTGTSSGSNTQGGGSCPSSCSSNADCSSCPLPSGTGKNCCVMGICAMMASCPTIRDSGRDGS